MFALSFQEKKKITNNTLTQEDFALALKLQQEEEEAAKSSIKCQLCNSSVKIEQLYVLDECSHKFCRDCITTYAVKTIQTSVTVGCPVNSCNKALSVRDVKVGSISINFNFTNKKAKDTKFLLIQQELIPKKPSGSLVPHTASGQATQRLYSELKHILDSNPEKSGYSVEPIDDNLYLWELKLFNFDPEEPLAKDLRALNRVRSTDSILLRSLKI